MLGFAAYRRRGDAVVFTHTEVDPDAGQSGVGSRLVRAALDDVRARGGSAVPQCSFVHAWIDRHEEYADLVTDPDR
jgi:predicted GNAT family acetyltransferase